MIFFMSSSLSHILDPPRQKTGAETRQPMFSQNSLLENQQTFLYHPFPIPYYLPFSSSAFWFVVFDRVLQYPGHILINISKYGNSLEPSLPTPFLYSSKKNWTPVVLSHHDQLALILHGCRPLPKKLFLPRMTTSTKYPPLTIFYFSFMYTYHLLAFRNAFS